MSRINVKINDFPNDSDSESSENDDSPKLHFGRNNTGVYQDSDNENLITTMKHKKSNRIRNLIISINILIGPLVLYIIFISLSEKIELFTWHPPLMTLGWIFLFTQGILSFHGENCFTKYISYKNKIRLHWILQVFGVFCILSAFIVIFINKSLKNKEHFVTLHAQTGLIALISLIFTTLLGVVKLYSQKLSQKCQQWKIWKFLITGFIKPVISKYFHIFSGIFTFILGNFAIILGFYSHWFKERTNDAVQILCTGVIIIVMIETIFRPINNFFVKIKNLLK